MFEFLPEFGGLIWTLLAFVVALSIIVFIHELGHYLVGRWSGIKADVFSLGFGPVLFSRHDRHGTKWQFAALPFGGYVKFAGDADAASATRDVDALEALTPEDRRHTMAGAPLWARAATVAAGPVFNFVLSILLFGALILSQGTQKYPLEVGALEPLPYAHELQEGDVLRAVAGFPVPEQGDSVAAEALRAGLVPSETQPYDITRDGTEMTVPGPYPFLPLIQRVAPQSAAFSAGLQPGDVILSVNGETIYAFSSLREIVESSEGAALDLRVWRADAEGEEVLDLTLAPRRVDEPQPEGGFRTAYRIGIIGGWFFTPATEATGLLDAVQGGVTQTWMIMESSLSGLYHIVTGAISSCNLSGPIGIAQTSGAMASQGTTSFLWFIALLSAAVGFLNLMPVPVLDGGHLVFFAWEAVTGRPPSDRALKILMSIGLVCVLSLMVFALGNDIFCP